MNNQFSKDDLKIVVIDCPMKYLDDPFVRDVFAKIAQLKVAGFRTVESKYFAFGLQDLVATHVMAGQYDKNGLFIPYIAYKAISEETSRYWGIPFDGLDVIEKTKSREHIEVIGQYIDSMKMKGKKVGYQSSLAISTTINCKYKSRELVQILQSMAARYIVDFDVDASICIARSKVRSAKLFERFGFQKIRHQGNILPEVQCPQYCNDKFFIMTFDKLKEDGWTLLDLYQNNWNERLEISERVHNQSRICNSDHLDEHMKAS